MRLPRLSKKDEPWTKGLVKGRAMDKKASLLLYTRGGHEILLPLLKKKGNKGKLYRTHEISLSPNI